MGGMNTVTRRTGGIVCGLSVGGKAKLWAILWVERQGEGTWSGWGAVICTNLI